MTLLLSNSTTTKSPIVSKGIVQLFVTASESAMGKAAAIHGPTYGIKRSNAAKARWAKEKGKKS